MANVHDYLRWRGDLSFAERPFNDVDNIVLSALVYLDFTGIVPGEVEGGSISVADACRQLVAQAGGDVAPYVRSFAKVDTRLVELIGASTRFGNARLSAYVDEVDEQRSLQFAALQVDLPDAGVYVALRGTDDTLVGWRENFMLSFEITEAQREASRYLERALMRVDAERMPVRVGGHSKGGNLAEFAAMNCPEHLREHVLRVYSNDGPGMPPEVVSSNQVLGDKLRRIVPSYSVVGMIFARKGDRRMVVASSGVGIEQHDLTTWQVLPTGFEEAPGLQEDCMVINRAIARWADGLSLDERKRVTEEVFDALGAGGATRVGELATLSGAQQVIGAFVNADARTHEAAGALVHHAMGSSVDAMLGAAQRMTADAAHALFAPRDITVRFSRRGGAPTVRETPAPPQP